MLAFMFFFAIRLFLNVLFTFFMALLNLSNNILNEAAVFVVHPE